VPASNVHHQYRPVRSVAALAAATRPARVLLTHLQMRRDADRTVDVVRSGFGGPVALVRDGDRFRVSRDGDRGPADRAPIEPDSGTASEASGGGARRPAPPG
jgi:hypothetical protein